RALPREHDRVRFDVFHDAPRELETLELFVARGALGHDFSGAHFARAGRVAALEDVTAADALELSPEMIVRKPRPGCQKSERALLFESLESGGSEAGRDDAFEKRFREQR